MSYTDIYFKKMVSGFRLESPGFRFICRNLGLSFRALELKVVRTVARFAGEGMWLKGLAACLGCRF